MAVAALLILVADRHLTSVPILAALGFAIILGSAGVQLAVPHSDRLGLEESLAAVATVLIVGLGSQRSRSCHSCG